MEEEIEELSDEDVELLTITEFDLCWTCPNCKHNNCEYDVTGDGIVKCKCENCKKTYTYYNCIY